MDNWDEIRTALHVAKLGTVSGAAHELGVHHATVIRHIDALEQRFGAKLFQRHTRGYTPTEAGQDLLVVADRVNDQLAQLAGRIKGRGDEVTGDLTITSIGELDELLVPSIAKFQDRHPDLRVRFISDSRLLRLEFGEAHVAIRAGGVPDQPDNVVQPFFTLASRLVASPSYVERYGLLTPGEFRGHRFIGSIDDNPRAPFYKWLNATIPEDQIVFRSSSVASSRSAILSGIGIGFLAPWDIRAAEPLVEMLPPDPSWAAPAWLVTHMDLHRTAKVQALLQHLKEDLTNWPID